MSNLPYTIIIGLEVHVQLLTESKMFCGCGTRFGRPPNTQTCPVCIGLPGALPVINRKAFELALKAVVALNCQIARFTKWDRKNYFYPDLPKGYQISQYDLPLSHDGWLEIPSGGGTGDSQRGSPLPLGEGQRVRAADSLAHRPDPNPLPRGEGTGATRRIGILRAHLEEDAGKSMHDEGSPRPSPLPRGEGTVAPSRIDLNRAGTPLLEIVSQPDLRWPEEAKAYLTELKLLLGYLGVSDCNMQEGSLRVDANVNLHIAAEKGSDLFMSQQSPSREIRLPTRFPHVATPIVEVKNMNSFRAVERALAYEVQRQWQEWQQTGRRLGEAPKSTRGWDEASQTTRLQRSKEESSDYRYFPDPDLPPVTVSDEEVERIRSSLGELPAALRTRIERTYGITRYDSDVLVSQGRALVDYFIALATACGDGKAASNWVQQDVLRWLGEQHAEIDKYPVPPQMLAELIAKVRDGAFPTSRGREVLGLMVAAGKPLAEAIAALGIEAVGDSALVELCRELIRANPKIAAEVRDGKLKGLGALIGQAKAKNPNVNPGRVREICLKMLARGTGRPQDGIIPQEDETA